MVSIIIATYNSEKTLKRALDSVLNQSFQDWECIVVDGASIDNTIEIVKEYVKKDSRFRYISEPDHGIYDAFNKGWKMAKGEWVMYLGSDDEYTKEGIKALMNNSDGADVVYGDTYFREFNNDKIRFQQSSPVKMGGFCCHQSLAMKREIIRKILENSDNTTNEQFLFSLYDSDVKLYQPKVSGSLKMKKILGGINHYNNKINKEFGVYNFGSFSHNQGNRIDFLVN